MTQQNKIKELAENFKSKFMITIEVDTITGNSRLKEDCGLDSLDLVEIGMVIEDDYGVILVDEDLKNIKTFGQLVEAVFNR
jgi:acyl carrier protein